MDSQKRYAVFLITKPGLDQKVTNPLTFQEAHDMAILLNADSYLEDPENLGEVYGQFVVQPIK